MTTRLTRTRTYRSKILGPHFEDLACTFARRYARTLLPGGLPGPVGTTEVADPAACTKHEVDVIALAPGERPQAPRARIALIDEVKATPCRRPPPAATAPVARTAVGAAG